MESEKYYTPDIEDLFIGYECEELRDTCYEGGTSREYHDIRWEPYKVSCTIGFHKWQQPTLRTPYLTKEDIEKEGWSDEGLSVINREGKVENAWSFRKTNFIAAYWEDTHYLGIIVRDPSLQDTRNFPALPLVSFVGQCKSINEFRKITKWLNIC